MKNLADMKRELQIGKRLMLVYRFKPLETPILKEVSNVQGNGIYLITPDLGVVNPSFLAFPKASLLEITKEGIRFYDKGLRDLTPEEKTIRDNEPKNAEQEERDALSDGSVMYWTQRAYYRLCNADYLMGHETQRGMSYDYETGKVWDEKVKGALCLEYKFVNKEEVEK